MQFMTSDTDVFILFFVTQMCAVLGLSRAVTSFSTSLFAEEAIFHYGKWSLETSFYGIDRLL